MLKSLRHAAWLISAQAVMLGNLSSECWVQCHYKGTSCQLLPNPFLLEILCKCDRVHSVPAIKKPGMMKVRLPCLVFRSRGAPLSAVCAQCNYLGVWP